MARYYTNPADACVNQEPSYFGSELAYEDPAPEEFIGPPTALELFLLTAPTEEVF